MNEVVWLFSLSEQCCCRMLPAHSTSMIPFPFKNLLSPIGLGVINIPAVALGMFSGGVIMKKYKLGIMGAAKFAFGTSLLGYFLSLFFLAMGCENSRVAGITVSYSGYVKPGNAPVAFLCLYSLVLSLWCPFFPHAEWKTCLLRSRLSSLTVIWVACAHDGSGIRCVARMGSPMCPRAWLDASPTAVPAGTRSDTHHRLQDNCGFTKLNIWA